MDIEKAVKILEFHNKWRRDNEDKYRIADPKELGEAIDLVVSEFKKAQLIAGQSEAFICPCCGSEKTYKTEAYHCNRCAVTTEI